MRPAGIAEPDAILAPAQMEVPEITARAVVAVLDEYAMAGGDGPARGAAPRVSLIRWGESVA